MGLRGGRINSFVHFSLKAYSGAVSIWLLTLIFYTSAKGWPSQALKDLRLWRTACVIYVTINWWNSNAHCCWICSFRKISKIIGPSIPQNHLKTDISMWDTLYLIEKNFWNIRLKPRICKNFEITKTVYVFKQNKMLFQHVPGDFFDLIHKYMRTIIIPIE